MATPINGKSGNEVLVTLSLNLHPSNPPFSPKAGVTSTSLPLFPLIGVIAPCDPPLIDLSFSVSYGIDIFAVMRAYT